MNGSEDSDGDFSAADDVSIARSDVTRGDTSRRGRVGAERPSSVLIGHCQSDLASTAGTVGSIEAPVEEL